MSYNTKFNIFLLLLFIGYVAVDKYLEKNNTVQPQIIVQKDTVLTTTTDTIYTHPTIIIKKDTVIALNNAEKASINAGNTSGLQDNNTDSINGQPMEKDSTTSDYYELEYKGKQDSTEYTLTMGTSTIPYWYKLELQTHTHIPTTETVTVQTQKKNSHTWSISPQVGFGYGVFHSKFDVYCGIGVAYHF